MTNFILEPTWWPEKAKQNHPLEWLSNSVPMQSLAGVMTMALLSPISSRPMLPLSKLLRMTQDGPSLRVWRVKRFLPGFSEYCGSIAKYYKVVAARASDCATRIIKIMTTEITEEIQVTGSLLSFTLFEEKLMRNFYIINSRLKRLDEIHELDIKIKALEKQQKFMSNKMDSIAERLPKDGSISRNDVKMIAKDQFFEVLNSKDDRFKTARYTEDIMKEINSVRVDIARIRVGDNAELFDRREGSPNPLQKASFSAGQARLQQQQLDGKKFSSDSLNGVLNQTELNVVNNFFKGQEGSQIMEQINEKFNDLYRRIDEMRLDKIFNNESERDIEKFEKYEHYEQKSQNTTRKMKDKPIRLDGIKRENVKGENLKSDLYAEYQKAEAMRSQAEQQPGSRRPSLLKGSNTMTTFKDEVGNIKVSDDPEAREKFERLKPSKSVRKLERIERRLKVDDIKDMNGVLKEIELRIEGRVTHEIFMGFVEDIEEKLQILKITKDSTNQLNEMRKLLYSVENRLQSVITYLQNMANDDDALLVKKQWTCISCDKNLDKYNAKVGQHLNWDLLSSKKISPTKAGAYGQTGQLANKIRNLLQNGKGAE